MSEKVTLGIDDGCAGVETRNGRLVHARDHRVELPAAEASRLLNSGAPNLHKHRRVHVGWSSAVERAYERAFPSKEA